MKKTVSSLVALGTCLPLLADTGAFQQQVLRRDGSIVAVVPVANADGAVSAPAELRQEPADAPPVGPRGGWQAATLPGGHYLRAVSMGSPQVGFAAGELGVVLRTTDGGASWHHVLNDGFPLYYYGVHAFDEQNVVISGFQNTSGEGIIRWSNNGGDTWGPIIALDSPTFLDWLTRVEFSDRQHGVIEGLFGQVQVTSNGGATAEDWTVATPSENWYEGTFTALRDGRVWVGGYDNIYSDNFGASWSPLTDADPLFDGPVSMLASGLGFIGGGTISPTESGWVYATDNAGASWTPVRVLETGYPIRTIRQLTDEIVYAAGGNVFGAVGGIWKSTTGGETWTLDLNVGNEVLDIDAVRLDCNTVRLVAAGAISQIWVTTVAAPRYILGDIDADGDVDLSDLATMLSNFGVSGCAPCVGDIDGDGDIDLADLATLLSHFGEEC